MCLVGRVVPDGFFRELEVDLADELAAAPVPGDSRAARQTQSSWALFDAVLEATVEFVTLREVSVSRGDTQIAKERGVGSRHSER